MPKFGVIGAIYQMQPETLEEMFRNPSTSTVNLKWMVNFHLLRFKKIWDIFKAVPYHLCVFQTME